MNNRIEGRTRTAVVVRWLLPLLASASERARPPEIRHPLIGCLFSKAIDLAMVAFAALVCGCLAMARGGSLPVVVISFALFLLILARCCVILAWKARQRGKRPADHDRWFVGFGVLAVASSCLWGALCLICLATTNDPVLYVITVLSVTGVAGSLVARNSGVPRLAAVQLCLSLTPICLGCIYTEDHGYRLLLLLVPGMWIGLLIHMSERNRQLVEMIETQIELGRLSQTDALTHVPNRRHLDSCLKAAAAVPLQRPMALLMVDVDHFKSYNDRYGHLEGDILLRRIATILSEHLRGIDDVVARYGGEEFALILSDTTITDAVAVGERLCTAVHNALVRQTQRVTISVGVASAIRNHEVTLLIKNADDALYRAKRLGRNRVEFNAAPHQTASELQNADS